MDLVTIVGAAAALASATSYTPQAFKIIRTREVKSISARGYCLAITAFSLWLTYGILRQDWPLIVTNTITLSLASFILTMKLLPQQKREKVADALDPGA